MECYKCMNPMCYTVTHSINYKCKMCLCITDMECAKVNEADKYGFDCFTCACCCPLKSIDGQKEIKKDFSEKHTYPACCCVSLEYVVETNPKFKRYCKFVYNPCSYISFIVLSSCCECFNDMFYGKKDCCCIPVICIPPFFCAQDCGNKLCYTTLGFAGCLGFMIEIGTRETEY